MTKCDAQRALEAIRGQLSVPFDTNYACMNRIRDIVRKAFSAETVCDQRDHFGSLNVRISIDEILLRSAQFPSMVIDQYFEKAHHDFLAEAVKLGVVDAER